MHVHSQAKMSSEQRAAGKDKRVAKQQFDFQREPEYPNWGPDRRDVYGRGIRVYGSPGKTFRLGGAYGSGGYALKYGHNENYDTERVNQASIYTAMETMRSTVNSFYADIRSFLRRVLNLLYLG